jgi:integrase
MLCYWQPSDFCSLRRLDDPICPTRFRFPSANKRLPAVLSQEDVTRLIASSLMHRTMIMTLYATGVRRAELYRLVGLRGLLNHCIDHRCWNRDVRPGAGSYFSATPRRPAAEISLATTPPCPG